MIAPYPQSTPRQTDAEHEEDSTDHTEAQRSPEGTTLPTEIDNAHLEETLPDAPIVGKTWHTWEYLPVALIRDNWPGILGFTTWVIFGDTYSARRLGVWHHELKKSPLINARVKVYAQKSASSHEDLRRQLDEFIEEHTPPAQQLEPRTTLYVFASGLQDCLSCTDKTSLGTAARALFKSVRRLYRHNARNFLLLDVLPGERICFGDELHQRAASASIKKNIRLWNKGLVNATSSFGIRHSDASVFLFSAYAMANDLLDGITEQEYARGIEAQKGREVWRTSEPDEKTVLEGLQTALAEMIILALRYAEKDEAEELVDL